MKNFKKIASAIAALSLAACVAVPMSATVFTASAVGSIQITNESEVVHTYEAYQIFDGDLDATTGVLSNVVWGSGIKEGEDSNIINAIKNLNVGGTTPFKDVTDAASIAKVLSNAVDTFKAEPGNSEKEPKDLEIAKAFATFINSYLAETPTKSVNAKDEGANTYTLDGLDDGYYLVKDKDGELKNKDDAYTRFILKVAGTVTNLSVKSAQPTVDKQVFDTAKTDDANDKQDGTSGAPKDGWGETADHAIGESFKFKLIANMSQNPELDAYSKYTLKFTDKMAKGVTYESIDSVKIIVQGESAEEEIDINVAFDADTAKYGYNNKIAESGMDEETEGKGNYKGDGTNTWQLIIPDLVEGLKKDGKAYKLSDVKRVEVVYNAHLNEEAIVVNFNVVAASTGLYNSADKKVNINDVFLEYSNNPNKGDWTVSGDGDSNTGKTTPDTVGVFTYKIENTKVDAADTTPLDGAVFSLYDADPDAEESTAKVIKLVPVYTGEEPARTLLGYRLATAEEAAKEDAGKVWVTEITTPENGQFVFYGLDAGTYYIKETEAPKGYNILDKAVTVEIKAVHSEAGDGSGANLTLNAEDSKSTYNKDNTITSLKGNIENNKGATLPSTGGIGTTLFYLGGGALVAVAGVMLITKKRMTKE